MYKTFSKINYPVIKSCLFFSFIFWIINIGFGWNLFLVGVEVWQASTFFREATVDMTTSLPPPFLWPLPKNRSVVWHSMDRHLQSRKNISIGEMDNGIKLVLYWFQMRIDPILMWKLSQLKLWPLVTFYRMNSRRPQWPYYYNSMLSN